ncbi:ferredoxin [Nocardia amikacinitolerans]|uniref:ferredoxin n=1 Tax=Nocardia amikacinitolerans TaxID=756689 RepID=UPI002646F71B|nr:ferredoxin [Nocardia amikacinitolerans]MCP2291099.1 ferredoxin [Nocardia amikacinitolerans]
MTKVRISANRERCIGAGMCALLAPGVFDQDDADGRVRLLDPSPRDGHSAVREALDACPSGTLEIAES